MYTCCMFPGIFEKHKLLFSFQICIKLEQDLQHVKQEEVDFFIKVCFQDSVNCKNIS